ncbi:MAG: hypothetical protein AAF203_10690, partial [Pseudomonadota bacterium]
MRRLAFLILFSANLAMAQVISVDKPELESQRLQYEQNLTEKIEKSLNNILAEKSYIVNVAVRLRRLGAETISLKDQETNTPKLDIQKEFNGEAGLLPLSKLGVWKIGGDLLNPVPSSSSYSKRVRNFTELIQQVQVDILLDQDRIKEPKVRIVRQVVNQLLRGKLPVRAAINIQPLKLGTVASTQENLRQSVMKDVKQELDKMQEGIDKAQREPASLQQHSTLDIIKEFKELIGTFFATIALFLMGVLISNRFLKLQEKRISLDESKSLLNIQTSGDRSSNIESKSESRIIQEMASNSENLPSGSEQFNEIIEDHPEKAAYMVKQWLYSEDKQSKAIVSRLPNIIALHSLKKILDLLSET